jgi:hypothetical protein
MTVTTRDRDVEQARINELTDVAEIRAAVERAAEAAHASWPQYEGYWSGDRWQLGFIKRTTRTRMGVAFREGDVVLYRTREDALMYVTAYSVRNGVETALEDDRIEPLATSMTTRHADGLVIFAS